MHAWHDILKRMAADEREAKCKAEEEAAKAAAPGSPAVPAVPEP